MIGLAKTLGPSMEAALRAAAAPAPVVGIAIALLVLLPESVAATRAAAGNRMQTSLNLALGLPAKETVLLALTLIVAVLTLGSGRATVLQGAVHLALFAVFLFLAVVP